MRHVSIFRNSLLRFGKRCKKSAYAENTRLNGVVSPCPPPPYKFSICIVLVKLVHHLCTNDARYFNVCARFFLQILRRHIGGAMEMARFVTTSEYLISFHWESLCFIYAQPWTHFDPTENPLLLLRTENPLYETSIQILLQTTRKSSCFVCAQLEPCLPSPSLANFSLFQGRLSPHLSLARSGTVVKFSPFHSQVSHSALFFL